MHARLNSHEANTFAKLTNLPQRPQTVTVSKLSLLDQQTHETPEAQKPTT